MANYDDYYHPQPRRHLTLAAVALMLLPFLLMGILALGLTWWLWPRGAGTSINPNAAPRAVTPRGDLAGDEKATIEIFENASPSVVHITTAAYQQGGFGMDVREVPEGTGSGFIWDDEGHVVTNYHVIRSADTATVTLADQTTYRAGLVGAFPDKDLAVLTIDAPKSKLRPIPVGTSRDLKVGQKVFAIGNPFGLDQSLTTGVVSALGRVIESTTRRSIRDVIQTDAAINPGNSGGPLLDSAGRLIGVNTAIYSPSGVSAGIGFAIPVDEVNRIVPELIRRGKVTKPDLGVTPDRNRLAQRIGVDGVMVSQVQPNGPAARAGLKAPRRDRLGRVFAGDVITAINDKPTPSVSELYDEVEKYKVGEVVTVTIYRDGEKQKVQVTLDESQN